jgi:hypothetical protein
VSSNLAGCAIHLNRLEKAVSSIRGLVSGPPARRVVANRYRRFVEIRRRQFNSRFSPKDDTRRRRDAPGAAGHLPLGGGAVLEDVMRTGKAAARIGSGHRIPAAVSASSQQRRQQQRRQQQRDKDKRQRARFDQDAPYAGGVTPDLQGSRSSVRSAMRCHREVLFGKLASSACGTDRSSRRPAGPVATGDALTAVAASFLNGQGGRAVQRESTPFTLQFPLPVM